MVKEAIKTIPGRLWNSEEKIWTVPDNRRARKQLLEALNDTGLFNVYDGSRVQMSAESPLEVATPRIADTGNVVLRQYTVALTARHYSERTKVRLDQTSLLPHVPPFLCHPFNRKWL